MQPCVPLNFLKKFSSLPACFDVWLNQLAVDEFLLYSSAQPAISCGLRSLAFASSPVPLRVLEHVLRATTYSTYREFEVVSLLCHRQI